jgi:uncharacterized protein (DUF983 family)
MDSGAAAESGPVAAALSGVCPRCGSDGLFDGAVKFAPKCDGCGLDFASFNVGDGAAAFLILIVGAILTIAALVVDAAYSPQWLVHLVWMPVGAALTICGLRIGKAFLLGQAYRNRAGEGRVAE